jgi:Tfp pilus assembly protein PilV
MSLTACNNRGITIVEVLITLFLTAVGILALLSMQPTAWNAAGRSDFMGRAAGILQSELERSELMIMNPNTAVTTGVLPVKNVYASSQSTTQAGDVPFTVNTTVVPLGAATNAWMVTIQITWPGNTRGIQETAIVSRQEYFKQ